MNGGVKTALLLSGAALGACSTAPGVEVRAIANSSSALSRGDALAVARGQFALGNVGLALEGFRKAQRDNPNDPAVLAGIGDCYAAMGRFDIAESSYEVALSMAPRDHVLLLGLASVLERGGDVKRGADIRAEAARFQQMEAIVAAQARAREVAAAKAAAEARTFAAATSSVTMKLPPARPAASAVKQAQAAPPVAVAPVAPNKLVVAEASARPVPPVEAEPQIRLSHESPAEVVLAAATPRASAPVLTAQVDADPVIAADVPEQLPVPKPVERSAVATGEKLQAPPYVKAVVNEVPLPAPPKPMVVKAAKQEVAYSAVDKGAPIPPPWQPKRPEPAALPVRMAQAESGPRLQRLNGGEVALVTASNVAWRSPTAVRMAARIERAGATQLASADAVRWVPLKLSRPITGVQVLNAARTAALAASARGVLVGRGWRAVAIGDATAVRRTSVVFYPAEKAALGRRLAAQFGVPAKLAQHENVVLVLGRDSVVRIPRQGNS